MTEWATGVLLLLLGVDAKTWVNPKPHPCGGTKFGMRGPCFKIVKGDSNGWKLKKKLKLWSILEILNICLSCEEEQLFDSRNKGRSGNMKNAI